METNLRGSIDLLKLVKSCVVDIKGVKCVVIPVEFNDIYVSKDEENKAKGAYLSLNIWQRREPSKYGKTHYVKPSFRKGFLERLTEEQRKALNDIFLGDLQPRETDKPTPQDFSPEEVKVGSNNDYNDLPF